MKTLETASISLFTATTIVVANMVGTGVFTSLGFQLAAIPFGFPVMALWIAGGVLAFCGAACYGELAAMMPRCGGEYHLLSESYHPLVGFLSGWVSVTVGFAAPIAATGLAFGGYLAAVTGGSNGSLYAIALVAVVTLIHLLGLGLAARFQVLMTTAKVLIILCMIGIGFGLGKGPDVGTGFGLGAGQGLSLLYQAGDAGEILSPAFALSLFWVMYAYSGWNAVAYVAGEVRHPERNVPLALMAGTGAVTLLYLGLNAAFLYSTPAATMQNKVEVGAVVAKHLLGESGGNLMAGLIAFGLVSSVSSMVWAGPRVTQVIGEDYRWFDFLSRRNRFGVPGIAILTQSVVVMVLLLTASFQAIVFFIQAILTLSSMLVVVAVVVLRITRPRANRPYRTWGYPVTPILFTVASAYMLWEFIIQRPAEMFYGLLVLAGGGVLYLAVSRGRRIEGQR